MKTFGSDDVIVGESGPTEAGSSATQMMLRCPKLYQYSQVRGIRVPGYRSPSHFSVGNIFGAMRREWFARKFNTGSKTWKKLVWAAQEEAEKSNLPVMQKDELTAHALMTEYIAHWSLLPKPRPVAVEYKLGPGPMMKGDRFNLFRTAKPDDISHYPEAGDALVLGDCKTTSQDFSSAVREYELHVQPLQYLALYKMDPQGEARFGPVAGFVLDIAGKANERRKKPRFARVFIEYRDDAVQRFVESVRGYLIAGNKIDWDSEAPRTYQCTYMYGRARVDCTYKDLCRFGRSAASKYVLEGGKSLAKYKPVEGAEKMPWE